MRKLIYAWSVSLDGFIETRDRPLEWVTIDDQVQACDA